MRFSRAPAWYALFFALFALFAVKDLCGSVLRPRFQFVVRPKRQPQHVFTVTRADGLPHAHTGAATPIARTDPEAHGAVAALDPISDRASVGERCRFVRRSELGHGLIV